jgi:hypothetical protein
MRKSLVVFVFAIGCGTRLEAPTAAATRVRVAHVSPGAPAVDCCLAVHGEGLLTSCVIAP